VHEIQVYWNLREKNTNHVGRARGSIGEATSLFFRGSRISSPPSSTAHWSQFWHPNLRSATAVDPGAETRGVFQRTTQTPRPIMNDCYLPVSEQFVVIGSGTCWQPSTVGWISSHFWSSIIQGRQNPGAYSRGHHAFHCFAKEIGRVRVGLNHRWAVLWIFKEPHVPVLWKTNSESKEWPGFQLFKNLKEPPEVFML
jgi:hypothetical protein